MKKSVLEKYKGLSFAEAAEKVAKKYPKRELDPNQEASFKYEMGELQKAQEVQKLRMKATQALEQLQNQEPPEKMALGGPTDPMAQGAYSLARGYAVDNLPAGLSLLGMEAPLPPPPHFNLDNAFSSFTGTSKGPLVQGTYRTAADRPVSKLSGDYGIRKPNLPESTIPELPQKKKGIRFNFKSNRSEGQRNPLEGLLENEYTPAILGSALSTAINAGMLLGGPDKVVPRVNPYAQEIKDEMDAQSINTQAVENRVLSGYNAAKQQLQDVRSPNVGRALGANLGSSLSRNLGELDLQEQQLNNQYRQQYASTLNNLGQQEARAYTLADDLTARNKGVHQSLVSQLGLSIADAGMFATRFGLNTRMNDMMINILNNQFADFGVNKGVLRRFVTGAPMTDEEMIKVKNVVGPGLAEDLESFRGYMMENKGTTEKK